MKLLMFSADYWPDSGGIAAHVYYLSRALANKGVDVTVIGGHRSQKENGRSIHKGDPIPFREFAILRRGPKGIRGINFLIQAFRILNRLADQTWDVIHFHNFIPDGILLGLRDWPAAKVRVVSNHSHVFLKALDQGKNLSIIRLSIRKVNGIISPSIELRDKSQFIRHERQLVKYIPNGVDINSFAPDGFDQDTNKILSTISKKKLLLAVRRHEPKCGLNYLVQAMPEVIHRHPDVELYLVGDGTETPFLKNLTEALGISHWVRFVGRLPHSKLPPIYRAAYVSILPSIYEAVSLSGLESLACGCPVIGSRVGGIPEIVKDGLTGLLVTPKSPSALAEALIYLLENPELRDQMSVQARAFVTDNFSWSVIASRTVDFYNELLELK
jgi:glycosyltransferase involved in cell wall biosynthesis